MKVLVAMDEFNGILSSYQANRYVEEAVASQIENADIVQVPLFNGRHEFLDSVFLWKSGTKYRVNVHDSVMDVKEAVYGITENGETIIESNQFLNGDNALIDGTSFALGEVIHHALSNGADKFIISVGGSRCYDGGAGMLQALGAKFYNDEDEIIDMRKGARQIKFIRKIDFSGLNELFKKASIQVMSDFDSKLYGKHSAIIQSYETLGITYEEAVEIDNLMWYWSELIKSEVRIALGPIERGGAGGGLAAILSGVFNAEILTSYQMVDQITHLDSLVKQADIVIFGDGIDESEQSLDTTSKRIAELTNVHNKVAVAICGTDIRFHEFENLNVTGMFNLFIEMPEHFTDFKIGVQLRRNVVQSLKLLKAQI